MHFRFPTGLDYYTIVNSYGLAGNKKDLYAIAHHLVIFGGHVDGTCYLEFILFWAYVYDWDDMISLIIRSLQKNTRSYARKNDIFIMMDATIFRDDFEAFVALTEKLTISKLDKYYTLLKSVHIDIYGRSYPLTIPMKYLNFIADRLRYPSSEYLMVDPYWLYQRAKGISIYESDTYESKIYEGPKSPELISYLEENFTPLQLEFDPFLILKDPERSLEEKMECISVLSITAKKRFSTCWRLDESIIELLYPEDAILIYMFQSLNSGDRTDYSYIQLPYTSAGWCDDPIPYILVRPGGREKLSEWFDVAARIGITACDYEVPDDPNETFRINLVVDPDLNY